MTDWCAVQHQMAPTFIGDSMHQSEGDKVSEAMTGGSLLGGGGMPEMPGLQAALAAASAAMQAAGQSMPPPASLLHHPHHTLPQVCKPPFTLLMRPKYFGTCNDICRHRAML